MLVRVSVPAFSILPPVDAVLPDIVLFETVRVPPLISALFPDMVLPLTVNIPRFRIPAPSGAAPPDNGHIV